jgi:hypothetical protein
MRQLCLIPGGEFHPVTALRAAEKKAKAVSVADHAHTWMEQRNVKTPRQIRYHDHCGLHIGLLIRLTATAAPAAGISSRRGLANSDR